MMLSGPSPGTEHYKEATLFISRVLDAASISPCSMESLAINRGKQEERVRQIQRRGEEEKGNDAEREREEESESDSKARDVRRSECFGEREMENTHISSLFTEHFSIKCLQGSLLSKE